MLPNYLDCVTFYEAREARISYLFQGLSNKLHRWMVELY
jgi:hypothetical protein